MLTFIYTFLVQLVHQCVLDTFQETLDQAFANFKIDNGIKTWVFRSPRGTIIHKGSLMEKIMNSSSVKNSSKARVHTFALPRPLEQQQQQDNESSACAAPQETELSATTSISLTGIENEPSRCRTFSIGDSHGSKYFSELPQIVVEDEVKPELEMEKPLQSTSALSTGDSNGSKHFSNFSLPQTTEEDILEAEQEMENPLLLTQSSLQQQQCDITQDDSIAPLTTTTTTDVTTSPISNFSIASVSTSSACSITNSSISSSSLCQSYSDSIGFEEFFTEEEEEFLCNLPHAHSSMFERNEIIGQGGYGCVATAYDPNLNNQLVAVKMVQKHVSKSLFIKEIQIMSEIEHPNIIKFHNAYQFKGEILLSMEYIDGLCLSDLIHLTPVIPENIILAIAHKLLNALSYIHEKNIIHRDIKSNNILINTNGSVKLIDFGLATKLTKPTTSEKCGTPHWMAPEVHSGEQYNNKADIWSLGVTLIECVDRIPPYSALNQEAVAKKIVNDGIPPIKTTISKKLKDLIKGCTVKDQSKRMTAEHLLTDSVFCDMASEEEIAQCVRAAMQKKSI